MAADDPVLDSDAISELRRAQAECGNPAFVQQLVAIFRTNAPSRMEQIREAIARGDGRRLEYVAHTLKSNCAMLGAIRMAAYCAEFEQYGERAAFDAAARLLDQAQVELARVLEAVEQL